MPGLRLLSHLNRKSWIKLLKKKENERIYYSARHCQHAGLMQVDCQGFIYLTLPIFMKMLEPCHSFITLSHVHDEESCQPF